LKQCPIRDDMITAPLHEPELMCDDRMVDDSCLTWKSALVTAKVCRREHGMHLQTEAPIFDRIRYTHEVNA